MVQTVRFLYTEGTYVKRYGLPYKGSKNAIAAAIIDTLPAADIFIDLFAGGCAVAHAAMESGKYRRVIANDINTYPQFFKECIEGKHTIQTHPEWISREDFHRLKDTDDYVKYVWSFGNNGKSYIYGAKIEEYKRSLHVLFFDRDVMPLYEYMGGFFDKGLLQRAADAEGVYERFIAYRRIVLQKYSDEGRLEKRGSHWYLDGKANIDRLNNLQSLQNLKRLEELESLGRLERLQRLESPERLQSLERLLTVTQTDYAQAEIPGNAVVYCDIPYKGTDCRAYRGFDHERFYEWAKGRDNIFISEYSMPPGFIRYTGFKKAVLSSNQGSTKAAEIEGLFTTPETLEKVGGMYEQLSLFG